MILMLMALVSFVDLSWLISNLERKIILIYNDCFNLPNNSKKLVLSIKREEKNCLLIFGIIAIGALLRKVNGSSSFCKGPRTSKV